MSDFRETPRGQVTLWVVGSQRITTDITHVHGYDEVTRTWRVSVIQSASKDGHYSPSLAVQVMRSDHDEWILAPRDVQESILARNARRLADPSATQRGDDGR